MAKLRLGSIETVGWGFWIAVFVVFLGPCVWGVSRVMYEGTTYMAPAVFGLLGAALAAGIVSWLVNSALQLRANRAKNADRKES